MQPYKYLALDVDGTLQNSSKQITEHTRETIIHAQEMGVKVIISSGRPTYGCAPLAEELQLEKFGGYILAFNGGEITEWATKKQMYEKTVPAEHIPLLYHNAKDNGYDILVYHGNEIIIEDATNKYANLSSTRNRMKIHEVTSFLDAVQFPIQKCLIVGEPDGLCILEEKMKAEFEGKLNVCRSEPYFMEITPSNIDKAKCLAVLLDKIGAKREELIACGDAPNDKAMIEYAGLGVAMGNAHDSVKEVADFITLTNDEDGVAHVVERFIIGQK